MCTIKVHLGKHGPERFFDLSVTRQIASLSSREKGEVRHLHNQALLSYGFGSHNLINLAGLDEMTCHKHEL